MYKKDDILFVDDVNQESYIIKILEKHDEKYYDIVILDTQHSTPNPRFGPGITFAHSMIMRKHEILPSYQIINDNANLCRCPIFDLMSLGCKCGGA